MQGVENTRTSVADRQVSRMMIMRSLGWCVDSLSQTWRMEVGIVVRCNVGVSVDCFVKSVEASWRRLVNMFNSSITELRRVMAVLRLVGVMCVGISVILVIIGECRSNFTGKQDLFLGGGWFKVISLRLLRDRVRAEKVWMI